MANLKEVKDIFTDKESILKIQNKLPKLFHIAELESSRAGKVGMEVGSLREKVIVAFLIYKFGKGVVNTQIPITEAETDVIVNGSPYSIKTITGNGRIKAVWTVDAASAMNFIKNYKPKCDIILIQINWQNTGGCYLIPLSVQKKIFIALGNNYLKMPKAGTNPRGVEFSKDAVEKMISDKDTHKIVIDWKKEAGEYDIYKKWVEYWAEV